MLQSNKKEADKSSGEKAQSQISEKHAQLRSKATARGQQGRRTAFIIGAVVIIVIVAIIGASYYFSPDQKNLRLNIITVDDTPISMDYFIKRAKFYGVEPMSMLIALRDEQLIKLGAPRYGIAVSADNITQVLRRMARGESETIAESEFQAWYRQELNDSRLSDAEYKEIVATNLLAARLQVYLAERMPTVAEHVHLHTLLVETNAEAQKIRARWEAGEAFADLAREVSLDKESKERGGELGWLPRGVLDSRFEDVVFNLKPGEVSTPIPAVEPSPTDQGATGGGYILFMVSEKADAREIAAEFLPTLKSRALEFWLVAEMQNHTIRYKFDSEINAWLNWQLAKGKPSSEQE